MFKSYTNNDKSSVFYIFSILEIPWLIYKLISHLLCPKIINLFIELEHFSCKKITITKSDMNYMKEVINNINVWR